MFSFSIVAYWGFGRLPFSFVVICLGAFLIIGLILWAWTKTK
jgi:hypothetical protein